MKTKSSKLSATMISRDKRRRGVGFVMTEGDRSRRSPPAPAEPSSGPRTDGGPTGSVVPPIKAFNAGFAGLPGQEGAGGDDWHSPPPPAEESTIAEPGATAMSPRANVLPFQDAGSEPAPLPDETPPGGTAEAPPAATLERAASAWRDRRVQSGDGAQALVQALRAADLALAENLFGELTGLSSAEVLRVLYGPGGEDLAMACRALGLEQLQFVSIFIMTRKLGLGEEALDPKELARIVGRFEATDPDEASDALAKWCG